ncbi:MAG: DUF433 domain-containing protein [Ktedonobacterales bacterium]
MSETYIETRDDRLYVRESRVPLESLVWPWREGHSAEAIQEAFSTLTLAEVYGAIAYYLDHQQAVDAHLAAGEAQFQAQRRDAELRESARYAALRRRFDEARARRAQLQSPVS